MLDEEAVFVCNHEIFDHDCKNNAKKEIEDYRIAPLAILRCSFIYSHGQYTKVSMQ